MKANKAFKDDLKEFLNPKSVEFRPKADWTRFTVDDVTQRFIPSQKSDIQAVWTRWGKGGLKRFACIKGGKQ
jgi:ABC-type sugar transport system substrate-binding protein